MICSSPDLLLPVSNQITLPNGSLVIITILLGESFPPLCQIPLLHLKACRNLDAAMSYQFL